MDSGNSDALTFLVRPEAFSIHRLAPDAWVDFERLRTLSWYSITRTGEELSVVVPASFAMESDRQQGGWACLRIAGTLDFALVGVIARVSRVLAEAGISIFAVSTFDTDYLLVPQADLERAVAALTDAGHRVVRS